MFKNFYTISRQASWTLFFVLIFALTWRASFANLDPDLGWHLKFGRDIALTQALPSDQIHLWTISGTWVDHEWLTNLIMFELYDRAGYLGLTAVFALMATVALILIVRHLRPRSWAKSIFTGLVITVGWLGLAPHLGPRPQQISWLFLIITLLLLKNRADRVNWRFSLGLALWFWFWACLHAGFIIGLAVLGLWAGQVVIMALKQKTPTRLWWPVITFLGSLGATLITPYGLKLYDFLSTYQNNAYLKYISEWKAIWIFPLHYWQLLFFALIIALTIILLVLKPKPTTPWWLWLASAMFLVLAIKSVRHFPLFLACASLTVLPEFIAANFSSNERTSKPAPLALALQLVLPLSLLALSWLALLATNYLSNPFVKFCSDYPCQVGRVLKLHPRYSHLKLLNHYDYGGWLIWVWPEKPLFIDGRLPQYPLANRSLLEVYLDFGQPNQAAAKLKDYDIEAILWRNSLPHYRLNWLDKLLGFQEAVVNGRVDELKKYLDQAPDWQATFSDDASTLYIRQDKL